MPKGAPFAVAFVMLAGLSGCVPYFSVRISGPLEAPVAQVARAMPSARRICVAEFSVAEYYSRVPGRTLWSIRAADGDAGAPRCIELSNLTYGQTPDGFEALVPPEPLQADVPYSVGGRGFLGEDSMSAYGGVVVVFSEGRWRSPYGLFGKRWVKRSPDD